MRKKCLLLLVMFFVCGRHCFLEACADRVSAQGNRSPLYEAPSWGGTFYSSRNRHITEFGRTVRDGQEIPYQMSGNPEGEPVIIFVGGPGAEISSDYHRLYDPEGFRIYVVGYEGCPPQKPLLGNTYYRMERSHITRIINDSREIFKMIAREHHSQQVHLMGNSFGAMIALSLDQKYPHMIKSLVLRSPFLGRAKDIKLLINPPKAWTHKFPLAWSSVKKVFQSPFPFSSLLEKSWEERDNRAKLEFLALSHWEEVLATGEDKSSEILDEFFDKNPSSESWYDSQSLSFVVIEEESYMSLRLLLMHSRNGSFEAKYSAKKFKKFSYPVSVIFGEKDRLTPLSYGEQVFQNIFDAERLQINSVPEAGHSPWGTHQFEQILIDEIKRVTADDDES